ncbi:VENN motif pre-toxin domain-containing protein [Aquitalea denitrificans]|uniref:VENN motif pre-toxin domain-containing protein n=1 Tax=Aquitalea denitrificans TaxID=519081 RepID=UPI0013574F71|nr:VENN motif pre-toxin domain-containing protein [Aquitalea denitrificans]
MKQQYGTGGDFQRAGQAISAAIQGLVGGDMKGAVTDAAAPYLAQVVKQMTTDADGNTNLAANAMAHAALGALLAAAKGDNPTAGAIGGGIAPITADLVMKQLYPGKEVAELNEEQKQTVAALTTLTGTLAGGLSTGNSAGAVTGGQVANNEVWNNALSVSDRKKLSAAADQCIKDSTSNQCGVAKEMLKKNYDDSLENAIKNGTPLPIDLKIMTAQYFSARKASLSYSFLDENQSYTASFQAAYGIGGQVIWDSKGGWSVSPVVGQGMSGFWGVTTNHYGSPSGIQSQVSANGGALVSFGSTTGVSESGPFLQTQFGVGLGEFVGSKIQGGFSIPIKNGENK